MSKSAFSKIASVLASKKLAASVGVSALSGVAYTKQNPDHIVAAYKKMEGMVSHDTPSPYPALELGEVSGIGSKDLLIVPGSITDANRTGYQFAQALEEKTGERPSYINSQMDFIDYPGQAWKTESALERNNKVVTGIKKFIEDSPEDKVILIAHSAGSKPALVAAKKYAEENPKSSKKIKIYLLGAGSPEGGIEKDLETLSTYPNVSTTELRTDFDLVPTLARTTDKHKVTRVTSATSKEIADTIADVSKPDPSDPFSDHEGADIKLAQMMKIAGLIPTDHFIENYLDHLAIALAKRRGKSTTLTPTALGAMLDAHGGTVMSPTITPGKLTGKPKQELK